MIIKIYPDNPNRRELERAVSALRDGKVIIYPTEVGYAYGCDALQNRSVERICELKGVDPRRKSLSIMCSDMSMAAEYCRIDNEAFRYMKDNHMQKYTFVLPAGNSLPKVFKNRKQVGIRLALHPLTRLLAESLGSPLLTGSLPLDPETPEYASDPELIEERYGLTVEMVLDGGIIPFEQTTVVDCTVSPYTILREGGSKP